MEFMGFGVLWGFLVVGGWNLGFLAVAELLRSDRIGSSWIRSGFSGSGLRGLGLGISAACFSFAGLQLGDFTAATYPLEGLNLVLADFGLRALGCRFGGFKVFVS